MMGMEKMIAQMLGITPEQMGEMITGFQSLLTGLQTRLAEIERKQDLILAAMGVQEDGGRNDSNSSTGDGDGNSLDGAFSGGN